MERSGVTAKMLRSVLVCLIAVVLTVGLLPVMPQEAVAEEAPSVTTNRSSGDWETFGTCEWRIDEAGCLTIRPVDGITGILEADVDSYEDPWQAWPWDNARDYIRSIAFEEGVSGRGSFSHIFYNCSVLRTIDLSGLDTSNVTDMRGMFYQCGELTSIDLSGLDTSNVTDMGYMFGSCVDLSTIDLSGLDTSNVTDMGYMFVLCESLSAIDLSGLDTSSLENMMHMFAGCFTLSAIDLSGLDTSSVKNMHSTFTSCFLLTSLDLSGLDLSSVEDMGYMFYGCTSLVSLNFSGLDLPNVVDMDFMFYDCSNLSSLSLSGTNVANVSSLDFMFYGCSSLTSLDLSGFDSWRAESIDNMFDGCNGLKQVSFSAKSANLAVKLNSPKPEQISGADGRWYNSAGEAFWAYEIPSGIADTYYASKSLVPALRVEIGFEATIGGGDVYTTVEWDDDWFDIPSTSYATSENGSIVYNARLHGLAVTSSVLSASAYSKELMKSALEKLGFSDISQYYPSKQDYSDDALGGYDQAAYTFAVRETPEGKPIVVVVVRGTASDEEWLSNLTIVDEQGSLSGTHEGFTAAAAEVFSAFNEYISDKGGKYDLENARMLITGHSRGAAVANILGVMFSNTETSFTKNLSNDEIYDFTFATPNTVLNPQKGYANIYNIVNAEDIVTKIPLAQWGYGRYGRTLVLPSSSNTKSYWSQYETMNAIIKQYTSGESYEPYGHGALNAYLVSALLYDLAPSVQQFYDKRYGGGLFGSGYTPYDVLSMIGSQEWGDGGIINTGRLALAASIPAYQDLLGGMAGILSHGGEGLTITDTVTHAHMPETYISWMQAFAPESLYKDSYRGVKVACPVDITVYDENNRVVASIVNDTVDETIAYGLPAMVVEDVKMVDVPSDGDYTIKITARDAGEMDFTVEECDSAGDKLASVKSYQGIQLHAGDSFTCDLASVQEVESSVLVEDELGTETEAGGIVQGQGRYVDVSVAAQGGGDVWGGGSVLAGSQTTVHAASAPDSVFDGWYLDEAKVSENADYTLRVEESTELVARFVEQEAEEPGIDPEPGEGDEGGDNPSGPSEPTEPSDPEDGAHSVSVAQAVGGTVTVSPESAKAGETVSVTAVEELGYEGASIVIVGTDGTEVEASPAEMSSSWTFTMPDSDVEVMVTFHDGWANPFSDVSEGDWFYSVVREANIYGLMHGYEDGIFGPDDGLMREQAATVMWNLMGDGDVSRPAAAHGDVAQGEWYAPYVNWAADEGVMEGYDGGKFGVGDALTREQFAAVIAKAVRADVGAADQSVLKVFPDVGAVSGWARETMAWAVENGLVNGVETKDGARELQATRTLTRAEMATMMMNAVDKGVLALL